jgi:SAM-dependent methyltransferase
MTNPRIDFYCRTIDVWIPSRDATVLVVGGGENDRDVFRSLGFRNVTISNVAATLPGADFTPFETIALDAEQLDLPDEAFDYTVVHAVLHHCASPHTALLELYRVARIAVIFFESRDSLTIRALGAIGLSSVYECHSVINNNCEAGGVRHTEIPNFIYRWTERDVEKTISCFAPHAKHRFEYARGNTYDLGGGWSLKALVMRAVVPLYKAFVWLFPSQQNMFGVKILKPSLPANLQPWLVMQDGRVRFSREWAAQQR